MIDPVTASLIIGGVQIGIDALFNRKSGAQKQAATSIVNQMEPLLKQNVDTFLAAEPKTPELKAKALGVFENSWQQMVGMLSDPALGKPGQVGVTDRARGGKWDWWSYYYDPILNEPVQGFQFQDYQEAKLYNYGNAAKNNVSGGFGIDGDWVLLGLVGIGVVFMMKGNK